jgi:hypothetical protein
MNIFFLDESPMLSAQYLHDKHVVKMRSESIQMIASVHKRYGINLEKEWPKTSAGNFYKGGYENHPCTRWAGDNSANYNWLYIHLLHLEIEYAMRFKKIKTQTATVLSWLDNHFGNFCRNLPQSEVISPPVLAMPDYYKKECPVESYRLYYEKDKMYDKNGKFMGKYTSRSKPAWLKVGEYANCG